MTATMLRPAPVGDAFDLALLELVKSGAGLYEIAVLLGRSPVDIRIMRDAWMALDAPKAAA